MFTLVKSGPKARICYTQGVDFLDIFPILRDPVAFETLITNLVHRLTSHTIRSLQGGKIDAIVGLDARGFLLGPIIALRLNAAFIPVRKRGKLPGECFSVEYEKEYGKVRVLNYSVVVRAHRWFIRRMCLRCKLELSCLARTLWLSTTSSQRVNSMYTLPAVLLTPFSRGFCKSRRRSYHQSGREDRRIPFYR